MNLFQIFNYKYLVWKLIFLLLPVVWEIADKKKNCIVLNFNIWQSYGYCNVQALAFAILIFENILNLILMEPLHLI